MNFKDIENIENILAERPNSISNLQHTIISEYIEKEKRKSLAKEYPFNYFYEDTTSQSLNFDFRNAIGSIYYKNASDDALCCLNICDSFYRLSSWNIGGWLQSALKFVDNIVLHYIQEVLKESPKTYAFIGIEKARYIHLSETKGEVSVVGYKLKELYDLRNKLEHRTIIYPDGRQELLTPRRNEVRKIVIKMYPGILSKFLETYRNY